MTNQILTPTQLVADGAGLDLTALFATPTQTTLQFQNTGREFLLVKGTAGTETVTTDFGATVLGQAVSNFPAVTLTPSAHIFSFGPDHSVLDIPGGTTVQVVLSTVTGVTVLLAQFIGVY